MPQNRNAGPGNVANELDALIPDYSVRCVRDFGRGCAGLNGFLHLPSVRSVRGLDQRLARYRLVGRRG